MWYSARLLSLRFLPMACLKSMELRVPFFTICCLVLFFTICCLVVCATICRSVVSATICRSVVCATIYVQERLRNGGRRVSLRPPIKTRYLRCVEEFSNSINGFSDDCGSMKISINQCQLLRSECLSLVQSPPPDSILKESFCAIRRALKLMQDCCSENWILKAVESGNCLRHFLEILLDLHRLQILEDLIRSGVESLGVMAEFDIPVKAKLKIENLNKAWTDDTAALRDKLESECRHDYPDHCLADQLKADPSSRRFKAVPDDIGRHVTKFNVLTKRIYEGSNGICVFPVTFCKKKFVIKMCFIEKGAEVHEDVLQNEAFYMKKCRHPYAVALLGSWEARRTDCSRVPLLLMEFMERDLDSVIKENKRWWWPWGGTGGFPALDAIDLVLPVAKVMKYLHEIGVVHLDLKPKNILYTRVPGTQDLPDDVSVKLADFGVARMAEERKIVCPLGTSGYMDPDVRAKKGDVKLFKADVFSFGMVFGEVLTGLSPLEALGCIHPGEFYDKLQEGKRVPLPKETPKCVKSIVESCWNPIPDKRPSFDDICSELQKAEIRLLNGWT